MRSLIVHPFLKTGSRKLRTPVDCLDEAIGLAKAIDLNVVQAFIVPLGSVRPATLIGTGKLEELKQIIAEQKIGLAVINHALSPMQQRNLEKAWGCKVIDRTALILEIFGARARTKEGKLQVELASLNYQKSRLVRSWTHLERQRGGFGFLGGPGESQIETDRRMIRDRIAKIRRELEVVVRTRELHRKPRREVPYPLVAIVGYTNAGKSTLFNTLTKAKVLAADALFATLDPTIRMLRLPSGMKMMLSDTVGFVSDLPTDLVAAFRATLEEVVEADLILHVRDISHPESAAQKKDVLKVLDKIFGDGEYRSHTIELLNKTDLLPVNEKASVIPKSEDAALGTYSISALTGEGTDQLKTRLDEILQSLYTEETQFRLKLSEGKPIAWLHAHGTVLKTSRRGEHLHITVRLSPENAARFNTMFSNKNRN